MTLPMKWHLFVISWVDDYDFFCTEVMNYQVKLKLTRNWIRDSTIEKLAHDDYYCQWKGTFFRGLLGISNNFIRKCYYSQISFVYMNMISVCWLIFFNTAVTTFIFDQRTHNSTCYLFSTKLEIRWNINSDKHLY